MKGFSFSLKRFLGIPTTKGDMERKIGSFILKLFVGKLKI